MIELARKNNTVFLPRFKEVYPEFTQNLLTQHPDLTNTELRLSALIFLNFASKEIADCMFITHRSVQTSKSRLRKKLGIPNEADLYQYFKSFT
jgi:DNA-binding CsgD family transcriptional regulator